MEGFLGGMFKAAGSPRQAAAPTGAGGRPTAGASAAAAATTVRQQQLHHYTRKTLGMGFIRQAVQLPAGVDQREWLALHCQDFFDSLSLLVGVAAAADEGSPRPEPGFGFPPGYEYLWMDPRTRRPIKCSGPDYIDHVLEWVSSVLNDARLFPAPGTASSNPEAYPQGFEKTAKAVFKRLFRIFAILYTHYYQRMDAMGAVAHLNTSFKHFLFFCFEFDLVASAELEAIESLVARMRQEYQAQGCSHGTPAVPENGGVVSGHQAHMESQEAMAVAGGP